MDSVANLKIATTVLQKISPEYANYYRVVPIELINNELLLYTDEVGKDKKEELEVVLGCHINLRPIHSESLDYLISKFYRQNDRNRQIKISDNSSDQDLLSTLIREATEIDSSDIHLERYEFDARVRMRVDGKLMERYIISTEKYPMLINRIKIQARLDIAEKRLPQDGRISYDHMDLRVSIMPSHYGEKAVLRLLSKQTAKKSLSDLGLNLVQEKELRKAISKSEGLILISGPTGSGKTTTLYSSLKEIRSESVNILTIEDPVEYTLQGINQVPLREDIGLNFTTALKAFLRQDPDIIMVGEIRDPDTAKMAIRASLTGHLVFSTIHTNSAWGIVSRLLDMGIPAFLIANTLKIVISQRLVRLLCANCKTLKPLNTEQLEVLGDDFGEKLIYEPVGCSSCYQTGFRGRKAIYELIPINGILREHINQSETKIEKTLKQQGIARLKDNALRLLQNGHTSFSEVYQMIMD